jgi:pyruvate dehydrogenase E1 component beta subunit
MRKIMYVEALREALQEEFRRDPTVFIMGEDIAYGYAFAVSKGLIEEFGPERVRDTPISENSIVGVALGAALAGMRAVAEIEFADLLFLAMDQVANQAAKIRYTTGGQLKVPLVVRTANGYWGSFGAHHSQSTEAFFLHVPGLKVAVPSTPYDAKGLLKTAIRGNNPVLFFEHKRLYRTEGEVPDGEYTIPFGKADIKRSGNDATIVAIQLMVSRSLEAADQLEKKGVSTEVIDPRTLAPMDKETIINSVKKTGRLIIAEEGCRTGGVGAEIAAMVSEEALQYLESPIKRVAVPDVPIPFGPVLENFVIPNTEAIVNAVASIVTWHAD